MFGDVHHRMLLRSAGMFGEVHQNAGDVHSAGEVHRNARQVHWNVW